MNYKILLSGMVLMSFLSCKKSSTTNAEPDKFMTTSASSTWNYQQTNSAGPAPVITNYTITSTNRDTTINSKTYHVYTNSGGANRYNNITSHDYYQFDSLPGGLSGVIERLYLKDDAAVSTSWSQNVTVNIPGVPIPIPITITNSIAEKGIATTVNGIAYTDVIHVSGTISSSVIPAANLTSSINNYYARKYGLIESSTIVNLNYVGFVQNVNLQIKLMSATLY